jgi:hypothetical protein
MSVALFAVLFPFLPPSPSPDVDTGGLMAPISHREAPENHRVTKPSPLSGQVPTRSVKRMTTTRKDPIPQMH